MVNDFFPRLREMFLYGTGQEKSQKQASRKQTARVVNSLEIKKPRCKTSGLFAVSSAV